MDESKFTTHQYTSSTFVESCGAVLFDLSNPSSKRVCIGNIVDKNEWILLKGRRNINESRQDAALREIYEETGYRGTLLPVRMATRATATGDPADVRDRPRVHDGLSEPFMCTVRELPFDGGVKIIWWYIATLNENGEVGPGEADIRAQFFDCDEAIGKLWFETDREVLRKAMEIVEDTMARAA
jgi:8-oxo-dGTP pyrophosphatase MutT (NUDIX family)